MRESLSRTVPFGNPFPRTTVIDFSASASTWTNADRPQEGIPTRNGCETRVLAPAANRAGRSRMEHRNLPRPHVLPGKRGQLLRAPTFSTLFGDRPGPRGEVGASIKLWHLRTPPWQTAVPAQTDLPSPEADFRCPRVIRERNDPQRSVQIRCGAAPQQPDGHQRAPLVTSAGWGARRGPARSTDRAEPPSVTHGTTRTFQGPALGNRPAYGGSPLRSDIRHSVLIGCLLEVGLPCSAALRFHPDAVATAFFVNASYAAGCNRRQIDPQILTTRLFNQSPRGRSGLSERVMN